MELKIYAIFLVFMETFELFYLSFLSCFLHAILADEQTVEGGRWRLINLPLMLFGWALRDAALTNWIVLDFKNFCSPFFREEKFACFSRCTAHNSDRRESINWVVVSSALITSRHQRLLRNWCNTKIYSYDKNNKLFTMSWMPAST